MHICNARGERQAWFRREVMGGIVFTVSFRFGFPATSDSVREARPQGSPRVLLALPGILLGSWVEWGPPSPCSSCCGADKEMGWSRRSLSQTADRPSSKRWSLCLPFRMCSIRRCWESLPLCSKTSVNSPMKALHGCGAECTDYCYTGTILYCFGQWHSFYF